MQIHKQGQPILTLDDWVRVAHPKDMKQWADNRSAKESARAWLASVPASPPAEILALLSSHRDIADLVVEQVEPEALVPFDSRNGPRNADIAIVARDSTGPVAVTVEAKADEPFDDVLSVVFERTLERLIDNPRSGGVGRLVELAQSILPTRTTGTETAVRLRYQLLTGVAGTLAYAITMGADRAVFVVHEFHTIKTSRRKLEVNHLDLDSFVARLSRGAVRAVSAGILYGPFSIPGEPLFPNPARLYIGKAVRVLGTPTP